MALLSSISDRRRFHPSDFSFGSGWLSLLNVLPSAPVNGLGGSFLVVFADIAIPADKVTLFRFTER